MKSVTTRLAVNSDGPAIKELLAASGQDLPCAFDDVQGYWLVAMHKETPVGCIQMCFGKPIGSLEMLGVDPGISGMVRGHVIRELLLDGMAVLHRHGAKYVRGFIPFRLKGYKRSVEKRGAKVADQGNMFLRRIG